MVTVLIMCCVLAAFICSFTVGECSAKYQLGHEYNKSEFYLSIIFTIFCWFMILFAAYWLEFRKSKVDAKEQTITAVEKTDPNTNTQDKTYTIIIREEK